jgi:hypothetical protein
MTLPKAITAVESHEYSARKQFDTVSIHGRCNDSVSSWMDLEEPISHRGHETKRWASWLKVSNVAD